MIDCIDKQRQHQQLNSFSHQPAQFSPMAGGNVGQQSVGAHQHNLLAMYPQHQHHHHQQQQQQQQPILHRQHQTLVEISGGGQANEQSGNELIGYYFGSISRETAEWILKTHGNQLDGAYLLRSSGPNDDFVLSLAVVQDKQSTTQANSNVDVLHYKIIETEDSFVALHGQVGDEKFATIDELIDKAQGVATKPRWPIHRQALESQILPPTYWGLNVDQVRLSILIKAKQWGFPLLSSLFQQQQQQQQPIQNQLHDISCNPTNAQQVSQFNTESLTSGANVTTLNNETIRTLIYKSLHEFQPWFHGKISREEAERRIEDGLPRDGRFLVRERDNYSYAMCISHKKTTKHYRIDVLPTGELAIQDGRKFTSLMALVSHYTIMSDGLWCALTEACPRPIQIADTLTKMSSNSATLPNPHLRTNPYNPALNQNLYCIPPKAKSNVQNIIPANLALGGSGSGNNMVVESRNAEAQHNGTQTQLAKTSNSNSLVCSHQGSVTAIKAPIKEWLQSINHKWSQLMSAKNQHQSLNSFLFGNQNPLNNHCRHSHRNQHHHARRKCKNGHTSCGCIQQQIKATNRAMTTTLNHNANGHLMNENLEATNGKTLIKPKTIRCCNGVFCGANNIPKDLIIPTNQALPFPPPAQTLACEQTMNTSSLLSHLPQNSGFTLNSGSFIGSPLFAVKQNPIERNRLKSSNGFGSSSGSGNSGGNNAEEEKLISPAQSISANLNNPYNINADIYGSQTSTAIVNDRQPLTSSSSSSSTTHLMQQQQPYISNASQQIQLLQHQQYPTKCPTNQIAANQQSFISTTNGGGTICAGPILCGQHAGPAYRYTNCTDENSLRPCYHRPLTTYRAADDLLLVTPSTQLAGPVALSKFVQFQDGQCLRTHRDTRSIQMAYLSSRQPASNPYSTPPASARLLQYRQQHSLMGSNGNQSVGSNKVNNTCRMSNAPSSDATQSLSTNQSKAGAQMNVNRNQNGGIHHSFMDVDLMDCGDDDRFEFKYDPKLIKSSSIETLCGPARDEPEDSLDNCKTNSELVMSLQPFWLSNQLPREHEILNPIPINEQPKQEQQQQQVINLSSMTNYSEQIYNNEAASRELERASILSSLIAQNELGKDEQLDHMKKKHDLDELTTALLEELTASLKAQVDLKNKRAGFGNSTLHDSRKASDNNNIINNTQQVAANQEQLQQQWRTETDPVELVNEFDMLISNNR